MKRLIPVLLTAAAFTVAGCQNKKKPAQNPNTSAEMNQQQQQPQPFVPTSDNNTMNQQPAPDTGSAPMNNPGPVSSGSSGTAHTMHHHAYASARHGKYTVKRGDTLSKIAHAHHVSLKRLEAANPHLDPNKIRVGQVINIP